jgi:hypothetical protein
VVKEIIVSNQGQPGSGEGCKDYNISYYYTSKAAYTK